MCSLQRRLYSNLLLHFFIAKWLFRIYWVLLVHFNVKLKRLLDNSFPKYDTNIPFFLMLYLNSNMRALKVSSFSLFIKCILWLEGTRQPTAINQCPSVEDSRTPLGSIYSLHPESINVDTARVAEPPAATSPTKVKILNWNNTPLLSETIHQQSIGQFSVHHWLNLFMHSYISLWNLGSAPPSPERARRTMISSSNDTYALLLQETPIKAFSPQIEEDYSKRPKSKSSWQLNSISKKF